MKLKFKRRQIETICTYIAYNLLLFGLVLWIFYRADNAFNWDIISDDIQRIIENFLIPSAGGIIVFAVVLSLFLNFSLFSINLERIADLKTGQFDDKKNEIEITPKTRRRFLFLFIFIVLALIGFKLWDKWTGKSRINYFIETYANSDNLHRIDSLLNHLNYQDTLKLEYKFRPSYYVSSTYDSTRLGKSNIHTFMTLRKEIYSAKERFFSLNEKDCSIDDELLINFDDLWLVVENSNSFILGDKSGSGNHFQGNIKDLISKQIFDNKMDDILKAENDGYEIYYRIKDSRNFEVAIITKTKPSAILNFEYNLWR